MSVSKELLEGRVLRESNFDPSPVSEHVIRVVAMIADQLEFVPRSEIGVPSGWRNMREDRLTLVADAESVEAALDQHLQYAPTRTRPLEDTQIV